MRQTQKSKVPPNSVTQQELTGEMIDAMSSPQKARLIAELESQTPAQRLAESRPLNAKERAQWRRFKKRIGRPKIAKGINAIVRPS
ncbi:MAG TPA: hypothetical protein VFC78_04595 [Tepidisphaeraceae bacterium]|nr:hypothetical protein [Tepidisphaeraceae bacterium]